MGLKRPAKTRRPRRFGPGPEGTAIATIALVALRRELGVSHEPGDRRVDRRTGAARRGLRGRRLLRPADGAETRRLIPGLPRPRQGHDLGPAPNGPGV